MIERSFGDISDEEMLAAAVRSDKVAREEYPDVTWEHSHVCVEEDGSITTFCVYDAPSEALVREHAAKFGGHIISRLYEIADDVTPAEVRRRAGIA